MLLHHRPQPNELFNEQRYFRKKTRMMNRDFTSVRIAWIVIHRMLGTLKKKSDRMIEEIDQRKEKNCGKQIGNFNNIR